MLYFLYLWVVHDLKMLLMGPDVTDRLYVTIEINLLVVLVSAFYFGVKQEWIAFIAALVLAVDCGIVGAINSVF